MSLFEALLRFDTKVLGKYNIYEPVKIVQKRQQQWDSTQVSLKINQIYFGVSSQDQKI